MRAFSKKTKVVVAGAAVATITMSGVAYAYWTTTGSGAGTASTAAGEDVTANQPTISFTAVTSPSNLAPGIASGAVNATLNNTSSTAASWVHTVTVTIGQPYIGTPATPATCAPSDYSLVKTASAAILGSSTTNVAGTLSAVFTIDKELAANDGVAASGPDQMALPALQLGFQNKSTDQSGCKGATVPLTFASN